MKIIKIEGTLGQQMFQYAFFIAVRAIFNDARMEGRELLPASLLQLTHTDCFDTAPKLPWLTQKKRTGYDIMSQPDEPGNVAQFISNSPENCIFSGNWASLQYFEKQENEVLDEFRFKQPLTTAAGTRETVALHIAGHNDKQNTCTRDYYNWAIANINTFVPDAQFHIYTTDAKWTEKNIVGMPADAVMHSSRNMSQGELMRAMAQAHHVVMSATLNDWWAAYLNPNPDKIVIAPQKWNVDIPSTSALLPLHWTVIPVT